MTTQAIKNFFKLEAASGIVLVSVTIIAMIVANTPLSAYYNLLVELPVQVRIGTFDISKPLLLWVNDGLMAIFFFLVGLELKREWMEGELKEPSSRILPLAGAIGGAVLPAGIYAIININDPVAIKGWAIPAATDIAFALGVLALLGPRVPLSLKVFLTSLAIFDDIGAVIIIACFYTAKISTSALIFAGCCMLLLWFLNKRGVTAKSIYIFIGIAMWTSTLKSGVHATLAGVALAMFIPMNRSDIEESLLHEFEHDLHKTVAFIILPIFAFCNTGINLGNIGLNDLVHPVPMGITAGLFIGKQLGVFGLCYLAIKLGWAPLPKGVTLQHLYGAALLTGIGFTMSLFIGSLAFEEAGVNRLFDERLGIVLGSLASGICGYFWLNWSLSKEPAEEH